MSLMLQRKKIVATSLNILKILLATLCVLLVFLPLLFHYSTWIQSELVFLPRYKSYNSDRLDDPSYFGVRGGRNHRVKVPGSGSGIGVWSISASLPREECPSASLFCNERPVVLYLHGQTSHRGSQPRTGLYRELQQEGFNVVTLDYRGYGDSVRPGLMTVETLVRDVETVLAWLRENSAETQILVWGHSLGSAVACHVMSRAPGPVCSLVLESAFNNLSDQLYRHSWASAWAASLPRPVFSWLFAPRPEVNFVPDEKLPLVLVPVIMIHAETDPVVSPHLARALFQQTVKLGRRSDIEFVELLHKDYGHSQIYKSPELPRILNTVRNNCGAS